MDDFTKKKLNLLIHLAKIDGDFHKSERRLIGEITEHMGFDTTDFHLLDPDGDVLEHASEDMHEKEEMMYLAFKLIQADDVIQDEELDFCKRLARKIGYKDEAVEHFAYNTLPDRESFDIEINKWKV